MESKLLLNILPQPDYITCGPTCLHAVYRYYGDDISLTQVIQETPQLQRGGTLASLLGGHALRRGYRATIYTFHLQVFDPTWFTATARPLTECLVAEREAKGLPRLRTAIDAYLDFLHLGGSILMEDLTPALVRQFLNRSVPILTGLSATYLYREAREVGPNVPDDIRGEPQGHFVVLCGYDSKSQSVLLADPLQPNPLAPEPVYLVGVECLICAVLLGTLTYDANFLIIEPAIPEGKQSRANPYSRL